MPWSPSLVRRRRLEGIGHIQFIFLIIRFTIQQRPRTGRSPSLRPVGKTDRLVVNAPTTLCFHGPAGAESGAASCAKSERLISKKQTNPFFIHPSPFRHPISPTKNCLLFRCAPILLLVPPPQRPGMRAGANSLYSVPIAAGGEKNQLCKRTFDQERPYFFTPS